MPKLLNDIEETILKNSRELLFTEGYSAFSMRRVASSCGIAVGTLYNYVKDKNELVAKIASEDWHNSVDDARSRISSDIPFSEGYILIVSEIRAFRSRFFPLFTTYAGINGRPRNMEKYHRMLRDEIVSLIEPLVRNSSSEQKNAVLPILAELALSCATHDDISDEKIKTFLSILNTGGKNE